MAWKNPRNAVPNTTAGNRTAQVQSPNSVVDKPINPSVLLERMILALRAARSSFDSRIASVTRKPSRPGTPVTVSLRREGGMVRLSVADEVVKELNAHGVSVVEVSAKKSGQGEMRVKFHNLVYQALEP